MPFSAYAAQRRIKAGHTYFEKKYSFFKDTQNKKIDLQNMQITNYL